MKKNLKESITELNGFFCIKSMLTLSSISSSLSSRSSLCRRQSYSTCTWTLNFPVCAWVSCWSHNTEEHTGGYTYWRTQSQARRGNNLPSRKEESKKQHFRISACIKDNTYTHQLLAFFVSKTLCQIQRSLSCIISCKKNRDGQKREKKISSLYEILLINEQFRLIYKIKMQNA